MMGIPREWKTVLHVLVAMATNVRVPDVDEDGKNFRLFDFFMSYNIITFTMSNRK